ncbi:unnamed protein product [Schistosoma margrebowiei]|uniref:Uncharacterized protein n=1 Tax=Schistosoma margrebowiei TaxID=48269 RepID=A0A183M605_9TREM|nr:unnamed protein product [Schistosoma margrebowiei]
MRGYNLIVLEISETHWTQAGQQRIDSGEMLLYSGHKEENATHSRSSDAVQNTRNALIGCESHGSRIIKVSFNKKKRISMNVTKCYALTNDRNDDNKDQFYGRLQSIIQKCPRKDLTILMGDLNVKVGMDNNGNKDIMARHGMGEGNENE